MFFEKIINFLDDNYHHKRIIKFLDKYKISTLIDVGAHRGESIRSVVVY